MSLPSPQQMSSLVKILKEKIQGAKELPTYKDLYNVLQKKSGTIVETAADLASTAAQAALTKGAAVAGVATGTLVVSFGAVLAPWIMAAQGVVVAGDTFTLWDLAKAASTDGSPKISYRCVCGKCEEQIRYVADKKETKFAKNVVSVFLPPVALGALAYSAYKSLDKQMRPKEKACRHLSEAGRNGCTVAIATIFHMSGRFEFMRGGSKGTFNRAVAILCSKDGWELLKEQF